MGRRGRCLPAVLMLAAALAGCRDAAAPVVPGPQASSQGKSASSSAAPAAARPQRIVSLNLCADQLVLQLADRHQVVAVSELAHDPRMSMLAERARGIPGVRGDAESILRLRPDLVLVGRYTTRYTAQMLRQLGVRVVEVPLANSLHEVAIQTMVVAEAVARPERGRALVARMQQEVQALRAARAQESATLQPVAAERSWMGYGSGTGTMFDELLQLAGYRNAAAMAGLRGYGYLPMERLVATQPDLLLTPDYGRDEPSIEFRDRLPVALAHLRLGEMVVPTRMTICGGPWSLDVVRMLEARRHPVRKEKSA